MGRTAIRLSQMKRNLPVLLLAVVLSACASSHDRRIPENERPKEWHPSREQLLKYDANHDGTVTKAEMDAGLKAEFNAADTDDDGCLKSDQVRAINERRIRELGSTATPLIDWNQDGCVDFNEFAGPARSLFTAMDRNEDGKLDPKELNPTGAARGKRRGGEEGGGDAGQGGGSYPGPDGN